MATVARSWLPPPPGLTLAEDEVHVWRANLDQPSSERQRLHCLLSPDEQERAARFHFDKDRHHYIVGRAVLRLILSRYLGITADRLLFCYNEYGKPTLAADAHHPGLGFNLSHSGGLALFAVTWCREIGIDLERVRADVENTGIAERHFSPQEVAELRGLPEEMRLEGFFRCWTRKEAYIKAHGKGLSLPLNSFDVSLAPGEPAALLATRDDPLEASEWTLADLTVAPGYIGALAVRARNCRYRLWQWRDEVGS